MQIFVGSGGLYRRPKHTGEKWNSAHLHTHLCKTAHKTSRHKVTLICTLASVMVHTEAFVFFSPGASGGLVLFIPLVHLYSKQDSPNFKHLGESSLWRITLSSRQSYLPSSDLWPISLLPTLRAILLSTHVQRAILLSFISIFEVIASLATLHFFKHVSEGHSTDTLITLGHTRSLYMAPIITTFPFTFLWVFNIVNSYIFVKKSLYL